ncbi:MAG TPA: endo-1,4-beta-xylanase [Planktothrix sp.]
MAAAVNLVVNDAWTCDGDSVRAQQQSGRDIFILSGEATRATPLMVVCKLSLPPRPSNAVFGQGLHVHFEARSSRDQRVETAIFQSAYPYAESLNDSVHTGAQWKSFDLDCIAPCDGKQLSLRLRPESKPFEFRDVTVTPVALSDLGIDAKLLANPEANIEKARKRAVTVVVLNKQGKPVANSSVRLKQVGQDFLFGTQIQGLDPHRQTAEQKEYQARLRELFNFATVTPYWPQVESKSGEQNLQKFDEQVRWLDEAGLSTKIHPLFWPHFVPSFLPQNPLKALQQADQHAVSLIKHFAATPHLRFIENNEIVAAMTDRSDNGLISWVRRIGPAAAIEHEEQLDKRALHEANRSDVTVIYNDYANNTYETDVLAQLARDAALPDAIGIQMHMTQGNWPLARVQFILNRLARFGKPLYVTEISVLSGEPRVGEEAGAETSKPWNSKPQGEIEQAVYVEKLYRLLFSNRCLHGITWWDLSDKNSWQGAPRGLLREDMTVKPAYDALRNLICKQWRTDVSGQSDSSGRFSANVFTGVYEITAQDQYGHTVCKRLQIPAARATCEVQLRLNGS